MFIVCLQKVENSWQWGHSTPCLRQWYLNAQGKCSNGIFNLILYLLNLKVSLLYSENVTGLNTYWSMRFISGFKKEKKLNLYCRYQSLAKPHFKKLIRWMCTSFNYVNSDFCSCWSYEECSQVHHNIFILGIFNVSHEIGRYEVVMRLSNPYM